MALFKSHAVVVLLLVMLSLVSTQACNEECVINCSGKDFTCVAECGGKECTRSKISKIIGLDHAKKLFAKLREKADSLVFESVCPTRSGVKDFLTDTLKKPFSIIIFPLVNREVQCKLILLEGSSALVRLVGEAVRDGSTTFDLDVGAPSVESSSCQDVLFKITKDEIVTLYKKRICEWDYCKASLKNYSGCKGLLG